jgi:4-hydroxymandelate oxidase
MDMKEVRTVARERMKGFCRVCPQCDGRACAGETPGMGGCGTASSFRNNVSALQHVRLNMRLVHEVKAPSTACTLLGLNLALPVIAAPIGGVSFNMGGALTEEQYIEAIVAGSKAAGTIGCTGDGVPAWLHEAGFAAIVHAGGYGIPFIKPWDSAELEEKLTKAAATGCPAIGMDIDAAGLITLAKMGRPVSPKSAAELAAVVDRVHSMGLQFILKGVMTTEDATAAAQAGCDAIVVSNHGGRVLDHTPGTAEVLPAIAAAVKGRLAILVDGGVRDGVDVLKMLALGADCVMIGRPYSIAALGGEAEGVSLYTETLKSQLTAAMVLTGCPSVQEAGMHLVNIARA